MNKKMMLIVGILLFSGILSGCTQQDVTLPAETTIEEASFNDKTEVSDSDDLKTIEKELDETTIPDENFSDL